jgi:ribosomal protein S18 acetylase RimI-like enzyme
VKGAPDLRIRSLARADAPAVLALARSLGPWFNREGLEEMERDLATHEGLVAEAEGRLAGFALWRPCGDRAVDLSWMGVAADLHRRGVGTAILDAVLASQLRAGIRTLEVSTVADSCDYGPYEGTRRFYRARGFRDLRVDPGHYGTGDDRYDRLVLRREVGGEHGRPPPACPS